MPACTVRCGFLLREAATRADLAERDPAKLETTTGIVVLAMGKYGAFELNYSSDIDLVVFYETSRFPFEKRGDPRPAAVDLVRGLVRLLNETTAMATCSGSISGCGPMQARPRSRSPPTLPSPITRAWARTGSVPQ